MRKALLETLKQTPVFLEQEQQLVHCSQVMLVGDIINNLPNVSLYIVLVLSSNARIEMENHMVIQRLRNTLGITIDQETTSDNENRMTHRI